MASPYAQSGRGGGGSVYAQSGGNTTGGRGPTRSNGGGGGVLGDIAHAVASKASLAGHDILAMPGGIVHEVNVGAVQPWKDVLTTGHVSKKTNANIDTLVNQVSDSTAQALNHPGRDPFQTFLTVLPAVHGAGKVAEKAVGVDRSVPRVLRQGDATVGMPPRSKNGAVAVGQHVYDKTLQRALDRNQAGQPRLADRSLPPGLAKRVPDVAAHAAKRLAGQIAESERPRQAMRKTVADDLEHAGKQLRGRLGNHGFKNSKMAQLALNLTSENITPREAHLYHMGQVTKGVAPKANLKLARLYRQMDEHGLLSQDEHGDVQVNAEKFPRLAEVDAKLARAQQTGDKIIKEYGLMTPEGAKSRIDLPGQIVRAGATEPEPVFRTTPGGKSKLASFASPVPERSIYGPEGRGYTTHMQLEKRAGGSPVARVAGDVVGEARSPIPGSKPFTGEARAQGKVPLDTTHLAAQHLRALIRYVNTSEIRKRWAETGSETRRSGRDVLIRIPSEAAKPLPPEAEAMLGRGKLTAAETEAHQASLREYLNHLVPGLTDEKTRAWEKAHDIGAPAYPGYKWVAENVLGDLKNAFASSRGKPGRAFDNVNSAITAATVYFKIGHVGTRALTDAATNIIEGSIKHAPSSIKLWKTLSQPERLEALSLSGQHGFNAMPHEGVGRIGRVATRGANFWARRFDAPFRFNSIAYQAAKAGYKTPAQFREFLDRARNPDSLDPIERVKIENVSKLSNRENISYDRLSEREWRYIARGLWFYPWVKGSTAYTMRALLEHPFKAALLGQAGQQGERVQRERLGELPSYEYGLIPFGHGNTSNFSTFSPMSTAADLLQLPEYGAAADNLNPAASFLLHLATRTNQYGSHSNAPLVDAFKAAVSPTPEYQIAAAALGKHSKMFPSNSPAWEAFLRMLEGPAQFRNVDTTVLNGAAQRERLGR